MIASNYYFVPNPAWNVGLLQFSYFRPLNTEVSTHLNSGNVIFLSDADDMAVLASTIKEMIKTKFELEIPIFIISQKELEDILNNAPDWWGDDNKEIYDNLIFMFPSVSYDEFYDKVGTPKAEYEKVYNYRPASRTSS